MARLPAVSRYLDAFARGQYFEAHEVLEELWWQRHSDPFLQGLILFAAAFVKVGQNNRRGAIHHFQATIQYLSPFLPVHEGLRVDRVVSHARQSIALLTAAPAAARIEERVAPFMFDLVDDAPEESSGPVGVDPNLLHRTVQEAIADRLRTGDPVHPSSWAPLVKDVARRLHGTASRDTVRQAVRDALRGRE